MTLDTLLEKFRFRPYGIVYEIEYDNNSKHNKIGEVFKVDAEYYKFLEIYKFWEVKAWFYDNANDVLHITLTELILKRLGHKIDWS